jgi:hypothetical protein
MVKIMGAEYRLFDIGGSAGIVGMGLMLVWAGVCHTRQLYDAERLP